MAMRTGRMNSQSEDTMGALLCRAIPIFICIYLSVKFELRSQPSFQNHISFGTSFVILPKNEVRLRSIFNQFEFDYKYVYNHISVEASYSFWNSKFFIDDPVGGGLTYIFNLDTSQWVGTIDGRFKYQFIDLKVSYEARLIQNISASIGIGPSYTWGINSYIAGYFYSSGIPDYVIWYDEKKDARWGGLLQLQAEYLFFNHRLSTGIMCKKRIYPNYYRQFEGGIRVGLYF